MPNFVYFEDVEVGDSISDLVKGPLRETHLMRWSSTTENWHRIHYDRSFATGHDKLPDILIQGSLKQQFLVQALKDWAGEAGWPWKVSFQFRAMSPVGEILTVWGRVTGKRQLPDYGLVDLEIGIRNEKNEESTPGSAVVALQYAKGDPLPYPFVPPLEV